jgi:hypothetical protein
MALNLQHDHVGVVIFGQDHAIHQGDLVYRTGQIVNVPVGPGNLGRVLDALGQPIDGAGPLTGVRSSLVEVKAPGIVARQSVREPLYTGGDGDGWGAHTTGKISRGIPKGFLARQSVREPLYTGGGWGHGWMGRDAAYTYGLHCRIIVVGVEYLPQGWMQQVLLCRVLR